MVYDPGTIAHFKGILLTQRVEIMARLQKNGDPVFVEELNGADPRNKRQAIERHLAEVAGDEERLRDIERSLRECKDGTYGRCSGCGMQILLARKEAIPTASRCVPCQAKHKSQLCHESREKDFSENPLGIFAEKDSRRTIIT